MTMAIMFLMTDATFSAKLRLAILAQDLLLNVTLLVEMGSSMDQKLVMTKTKIPMTVVPSLVKLKKDSHVQNLLLSARNVQMALKKGQKDVMTRTV